MKGCDSKSHRGVKSPRGFESHPLRLSPNMELQLLSWRQFRELAPESVLLGVGTLEAHGEGPLGTDNLIPERLVRRLSERLKIPFLPLMPYGVTTSLLYPCAIRLEPETLEAFLYDVGASLARHGVKNLIVINGHGGNTGPLKEAARRLFLDLGLRVAVIDWWVPVRPYIEDLFPEGLGHAAMDEMAALKGLWPELALEGEQRVFYYGPGLAVYPSPEAVQVYRSPDEKVNWSEITPQKAEEFVRRTLEVLEGLIRKILEGWRNLD